MKMRQLCSDGPQIFLIGYGPGRPGAAGGAAIHPTPTLIAAMQAGFERGMNWVDTAEAYGAGHSEELVGQAIAKRDDILVFSKVVFKPFGSGLDAVGIRTGAQASLRREVLALYQIHLPDPTIPIEESWGAMARLVEEGLVRFTRSQEQKLLSGRKNSLNSLQEGNYGHDH